jgi:hypothetical protein
MCPQDGSSVFESSHSAGVMTQRLLSGIFIPEDSSVLCSKYAAETAAVERTIFFSVFYRHEMNRSTKSCVCVSLFVMLQELGLYALTDILRGSVRVEKNPLLCYVDTVNWELIAKGEHPSIAVRIQNVFHTCG